MKNPLTKGQWTSQRTKAIIRLRTQKTPKSLDQIGRKFNLTRERIRQILKKNLVNYTKYNLTLAGRPKVERIKLHCAECKKVVLITPKDLEKSKSKTIFCNGNCLAQYRKRKFKNLLRHGRVCIKCKKKKPITAYTIRYSNQEKTRGFVYPTCKSCHGKICYQNHLKLKKKYPKKIALQQKASAKKYQKEHKEKIREYGRNRYAIDPAYRARARKACREYYYRTKLNKKKKLR